MSSGGMDWAYRMIGAHDLDPLGGLIVFHLGWRDAADFRTDRGIARALNQHRASVQKATAKLAALGIIERRSDQWVAVETVKVVLGAPDARRPSPAAADGRPTEEAGLLSRPGPTEEAGAGLLSRPARANSVGHKRKENYEKGRAVRAKASSRSISGAAARPPAVRPSPSPVASAPGVVAVDLASLSAYQRTCVREERPVPFGGGSLHPASPEAVALRQALRAELSGHA